MMKERLMFVYRGVVTDENSVSLLSLLEKEMENSEFGFIGRKRLFMFVLESLQNVSRHGVHDEHSSRSLVLYSKIPTGYTVTTGNVLRTSKVARLKEQLDEINNLNPEEIKAIYRQMLSTATISESGGAGLGLLEMAKKTGNKLDYDFVSIDNDFSYFVLSKTVNSLGVGMHTDGEEKVFAGKKVSSMEQLMSENDIYLIWSGHLSNDVEREVLSFNETKLTEADIEMNLRRRVFSILVEILENVAKYSPGNVPEEEYGLSVAMIRVKDDVYTITTGNLIDNNNVEILKSKIDAINENDRSSLKEMFRGSISEQTISTESTGNLGLIEMARKSGGRLTYRFEKLNEKYSYYILTVTVQEAQ
jgi:hypothetical protein